MIHHIPHSSPFIPAKFRDQIILSDEELKEELLLMTDAYTDELFSYKNAKKIVFPISRLLVDVERFKDDDKEPMSEVGMGVIYTNTSQGNKLKRGLSQAKKSDLMGYYHHHHKILTEAVEQELNKKGHALLIDCHSFPSKPLPFEQDQSTPRPDICLGTNAFHTPNKLMNYCRELLEEKDYEVKINEPYKGTIVPHKFLRKDKRVLSLMIEVNRSLYMNERTGERLASFNTIQNYIQEILNSIYDVKNE